ncbi:fructose-bisphosphatase class II, partial [Klebsiella pneumoniae]
PPERHLGHGRVRPRLDVRPVRRLLHGQDRRGPRGSRCPGPRQADRRQHPCAGEGQGDLEDMVVAVLDRPRHDELIRAIRATGAGTRLLLDGDVAGGIAAALPGSAIDMCVGVGGTPEGIITACAIKALGGVLLGKLQPKDDEERERAIAAGHDLDKVLD